MENRRLCSSPRPYIQLVQKIITEAKTTLIRSSNEDFGSGGKFEFPSGYEGCDYLSLHPDLIQTSATLLGCSPMDIRLMQSDVWPKVGVEPGERSPLSNDDQRIHCDYGNNSLLHPPSWSNPECVSMIVYLSDESECGGGTAVVPRTGDDDAAYKFPLIAMPGYGGLPFINDKTSTEKYMKENQPEMYEFRQDLYNRERITKFKVGTVLLYRGTPVTPGKLRIVCNLGYFRKDATWNTVWNQGWARKMYYGTVEKIVAKSSILQRSAMGIPEPGFKYWTKETIEYVMARFGPYGFDPEPYYKALRI